MLRIFALSIFLGLAFATRALAVCATGSMPFQLQNNTTADATQVMANFNQITTGVGASCAASGVNNDITALGALTTQITPNQGGTAVFVSGASSGSPNAQSLSVNPNFTLTAAYHISGFFGQTNTGPLTMQVNGGPATLVMRKQQFGISSTQGGEAIAGHPFEMVFNGTNWLLMGETILIGEMKTMLSGTATPPPGWMIADGSSFVCATLVDLCNVIGTTYGGTSSNPNLPDMRGRIATGLDSFGTGAGAANRLTSIATGCGSTFTGLGATCLNGSQNHTQVTAEVGVHTHTDAGHTHSVRYDSGAGSGTGTGPIMEVSSGGTNTNPGAGANSRLDGTVVVLSGNANIQNNAAPSAMPIVPNNLGAIMIIRF